MSDSTFTDVPASSPRQYAYSLSQEGPYRHAVSLSDSDYRGYNYHHDDHYRYTDHYKYNDSYGHHPAQMSSASSDQYKNNSSNKGDDDGIASFVDKAKTCVKAQSVAEQAFARTLRAYDDYERLADEFEAELHRREVVRQAEQAQAQAQLALARAQEIPASRGGRGKRGKKNRAAVAAASAAAAVAKAAKAAKAAAAVVEAEATLPSPAPSSASASPHSASAHTLPFEHSGLDSSDSVASTTASTPCRQSVEPETRRNKRKQHVPVHPAILDRIPGVTLRIHSSQPLSQGEDVLPFQRMTEKHQLEVEITKSLRDYTVDSFVAPSSVSCPDMSNLATAPVSTPTQATSTSTTATATSLAVSGQPLSWETLSSQEFVLNRVTGQAQIWQDDEDRLDLGRLELVLQTMLARQHRERYPDLYPMPIEEVSSMSLSEAWPMGTEEGEEETTRGKRGSSKMGARTAAKKVESTTVVSATGRALRASRRSAAAKGHHGEAMTMATVTAAVAVQAQSTASVEDSMVIPPTTTMTETKATVTTTATTTTAGGGLVEMYDDIERVLKAKRAKKREEKRRLQEEVESMKRSVLDHVLDDKSSSDVHKGMEEDEEMSILQNNNNQKRPLSLTISASMTAITHLPQAQVQAQAQPAFKIRKLSCEPAQDAHAHHSHQVPLEMDLDRNPPSMSPPSPPHSRHGSPSKLGQSLSYEHGPCTTNAVLHEGATEFEADENPEVSDYGLDLRRDRTRDGLGLDKTGHQSPLQSVLATNAVTSLSSPATTTSSTVVATTTATTPPATPTRANADRAILVQHGLA